jgi:dTDP-4-dehydrorhamnose reductase
MKALIIGAKGQLGTTLTQTVPNAIEPLSLDLPEFDITDSNSVDDCLWERKTRCGYQRLGLYGRGSGGRRG